MALTRPIALVLISLMSSFISTSAQSCKSYAFSTNQLFSACNDLPYLNSFLHWTYDPASTTVQIAYRQTRVSSSTWVAWAINPGAAPAMVGSQALVAYRKPDGTMRAYKSSVDSYQITTLKEADKLDFDVGNLSATYANNEMIIFATLGLSSLGINGTWATVNQVWQNGPLGADGSPQPHDTTGSNVMSLGTVDLLSGEAVAATGGSTEKTRKRNIHGVLNTVSWGIMMPLGALIARYLRVFKSADPAWFYLHVSCQSVAYIVGVAGWGTGLKLGAQSPGIQFDAHRTIAIILFCLGTLQVFALLLRPKPDHKYRLYWNMYHHGVGYSVIILSVINIFKGFNILNPDKKWKNAYIGVIAALAANAVWLEAYTWFVVLKRRRSEDTGKVPPNSNNRSNGFNGFGGRV